MIFFYFRADLLCIVGRCRNQRRIYVPERGDWTLPWARHFEKEQSSTICCHGQTVLLVDQSRQKTAFVVSVRRRVKQGGQIYS